MKIEDNKVPLFIVLVIAIFAIGAIIILNINLGELMGASLISSSFVTETDGTSYVYVQINENTYDAQDIGTVKNIGFESIPIDGQTNSEGDPLEGEFTSTFQVKINDIGFGSVVTPYTTNPIVNHGQIDGLIFKTFSYTIGDSIKYYQVTGDTSIISSYTVIATINGEKFEELIDQNNRGLVYIEGTDPAIYWDEGSFGLSKGTQLPTGLGDIDIILDPQEKVNFVKKDQTIQMVEFWNAIFKDNYVTIRDNTAIWDLPSPYLATYHAQIPKRIDLDNDGEYDLDAPGNDFTYMNLMSNIYRFKSSSTLLGRTGSMWIDFPSGDKAPFASTKDTTGYSIVTTGDEYLKKDTTLTIGGVWRIPVEYGDVRVKTILAKPEFANTPKFTETLYTTTTTNVEVKVKNVGDTGPITVWVTATGSPGLILPPEQTETVVKGDIQTYILTFKGESVKDNGIITIHAKGGVDTVTSTISYTVSEISTNEPTYRLIINAVDENDDLLGSEFPITVSQNSKTSYGTWIGDVITGTVTISGDEVVYKEEKYYPNDFTYEVTEDATISLIYTTTPPGEEGINWTYIYIAIFVLLLMCAAMWLWRD